MRPVTVSTDVAVRITDPAGDVLEVRPVLPPPEAAPVVEVAAAQGASTSLLSLAVETAPGWRERLKRFLDVVFALLVLVVSVPLIVLLAATVKLSSPGPVFYGHRRVGRDGREFDCWKFRTMVTDADRRLEQVLAERPDLREEFTQSQKLREDPRITRLGRWLRRTSLDELPQFWNVLRGEMSVVGPRPLVAVETARYGESITTILRLRPGITGVWQTSGRNDLPYAIRVEMDERYVRSWSVGGDLRIVLRTVGVVLRPRRNGAY